MILSLSNTTLRADDLSDAITTIRLRSTVRLAADDSQVTIADLATITGPQASEIESIPLELKEKVSANQWIDIESKSIRALLKDTPHIRVGSVLVVGAQTIALTRRIDPSQAINTAATSSSDTTTPQGPILKQYLEQWVYAQPWLKSNKASTRIRFDKNARIEKILNTPMTNRTVMINEIGRSKKISCEIIVLENEKIILETTIRFTVEVQRKVRVVSEQIRRGEVIDEQRTVVETRWLSPMAPIADVESSLGLVCKTTIDAGSMLIPSMIEEPIIVRRGQFVTARSFHGSASVTMSVRALKNGKLGDLIELESRDRKQHFTARVAAPGRVVIVPNPSDSK